MLNKTNGIKLISDEHPDSADWTPDEKAVIDRVLAQNPPIEKIPIGAPQVDHDYQTRNRERIIKQIQSDFQPGALDIIRISRRPDGRLFLVDGVTRQMALVGMGEKNLLVDSKIYGMSGQREEAIMFVWWNSNDSHTPIQIEALYQSRHIGGIDQGFGTLIEKCGFKINASGTYNKLRGVSWVRKAFDLDGIGQGANSLERTLWAAKKEWSEHKQWGYMILGIARVYHYWNGNTIDDQVRSILKRHSPAKVMQEVAVKFFKAAGQTEIRPDRKPELIEAWTAGEINKHARKGNKIVRSDS